MDIKTIASLFTLLLMVAHICIAIVTAIEKNDTSATLTAKVLLPFCIAVLCVALGNSWWVVACWVGVFGLNIASLIKAAPKK
jgi:hypothetical protein